MKLLPLLVGSMMVVLAVRTPAHGADAPAPPNVVFLVSDDQRWTDYGFMGHPYVRTPRLDRLSRESLTFTRGYVPTSLCRPSLMTMVTGLYPHEHGVTGNDPQLPAGANAGRARADVNAPGHGLYEAVIANVERRPTLPRMLRDRGYLTYQCGKWWEGDPKRAGFTHHMSHGDAKRGGRHGDVGLEIGRKGIGPIVEFLDEAKASGKPFFVWYAPFLPHDPHNPPAEYLRRYEGSTAYKSFAAYWAMCEWFDATCGQVLDELDRRGLRENTIVVYVCDNGWNPPAGPYANVGHGGGGSRAKRSPYDGGIRTPIMIRYPVGIEPRTDNATLASSIDIVPTVLAACGIEPPAGFASSGLNLLDRAAAESRTAIYGEIFEHDIADVNAPAASLRYRWIIEGDTKLIVPTEAVTDAKVELFDLAGDVFESRNLAEQERARAESLRAKLDAWWKP